MSPMKNKLWNNDKIKIRINIRINIRKRFIDGFES